MQPSSTTSTTAASVEALKKTHDALLQIQTRLKPFLQNATSSTTMDTASSGTTSNPDSTTTTTTTTTTTANQRALSQAAVALSIATMRVVGARLQGLDRGRKADDPLRQELNRIRTALVAAQQKLRRDQQPKQPEGNEEQPGKSKPKEEQPSLDHTATNEEDVTSPSKRKHEETSNEAKVASAAKRARTKINDSSKSGKRKK
jgi:hypothetical protein